MASSLEIFTQTIENNSSEKIIEKIKNGQWEDILKGLCSIRNNSLFLDYIYFKYFSTKETYKLILDYITNAIDTILTNNSNFIVHVNMKNLTILEIDKHKTFIQTISHFFKERYPEKLSKCYIYNASFVFTQIFNILSVFIDKETQTKIELVVTK